MRILAFDELDHSMDLDRTLIHLAAFGGVFPTRAVDILRRLKSLADYVGVFAVEKGRVLGQVFVLRIPYAFRDGPGMVSGIAAVGTRPDRGRVGIARSLLAEVHRREREAGLECVSLWTNRSWGAHGLYEKLGYRDVYSSPWVVSAPRVAGRRSVRRHGLRPARLSDLTAIDRLHDLLAEDRLGFYRRPKGFSRAKVRLAVLDPAKNLVVAWRGGEIVGYAHLGQNPHHVICGELVAESTAARRSLISEVERSSKEVPIAFQHTLVTDTPGIFQGPGYSTTPEGWYVMMGGALGRDWTQRQAVDQFATKDPKFICLAGDRF
jgi:predicted N-acetyltransferase YhbS